MRPRVKTHALPVIVPGVVIALVSLGCCVQPEEASLLEEEGNVIETDDAVFHQFDEAVETLIQKWGIPGASLAVGYEGKVVHAKGFGWADQENHVLVVPASVFRIASVSKPITAAAVLTLVDGGKISLEDKVLPLLQLTMPTSTTQEFDKVTIEQLLQHSAGFDRYRWRDSEFHEATVKLVMASPNRTLPETNDLVSAHMSTPLAFFPGTRFAYSNLGYLILGRLIEQVSGKPYEEYVRQHVLAPVGAAEMRVGQSLPEDRAPNEVRYYEYPDAGKTVSVYDLKSEVPRPDGGFHLPALGPAMGWVGTASDLVRWASQLFGDGEEEALLSEQSLEAMLAPPKPILRMDEDSYYGYGWYVEQTTEGPFLWHNGTLPGSSALLARQPNGLVYAVLMNGRPRQYDAFKEELNSHLRAAGAHASEAIGRHTAGKRSQ